jgi:hypothetical protein
MTFKLLLQVFNIKCHQNWKWKYCREQYYVSYLSAL